MVATRGCPLLLDKSTQSSLSSEVAFSDVSSEFSSRGVTLAKDALVSTLASELTLFEAMVLSSLETLYSGIVSK